MSCGVTRVWQIPFTRPFILLTCGYMPSRWSHSCECVLRLAWSQDHVCACVRGVCECVHTDHPATAASMQVLVAPLVRLTNQKDAKIEDIGTPEAFIASVGPFITGTYLDLDDVVDMSSQTLEDGLTYYYYDVCTHPLALLTSDSCLCIATLPGKPACVRCAPFAALYMQAYATYGTNGPHTLTACTVKGDLALLFCLSANDKQYARSKGKLNTMIKTFRA